MKDKPSLGEFFDFTPRERIGVITLLLLITALQLIPSLYSIFYKPDEAYLEDTLRKLIKESGVMSNYQLPAENTSRLDSIWPFDPNTISKTDLQRMGVSPSAARNLVKYRENGGYFRTAHDVQKIYGLATSTFDSLAPFMIFSDSSRVDHRHTIQELTFHDSIKPPLFKKGNSQLENARDVKAIDINEATAAEFDVLKGIGPVLSKRIVNFRDVLGGFVNIQQIREVYGLPEETADHITPFLQIKIPHRMINPDSLSFKELLRHPYINFEMAKVLKNNSKASKSRLYSLLSEAVDSIQVDRLWPYLYHSKT